MQIFGCFAYAALSNKERKQRNDKWKRCGITVLKKKNRLKSNCFVLRCNDNSWRFSPLIMIKVSRGSLQDIVWETDGLLFYCDIVADDRLNEQ